METKIKRGCMLLGTILLLCMPMVAMAATAKPTSNKVVIITENGEQEANDISVYTIDGKNYFMLKDIGRYMNYHVSWNEETRRVQIDSSRDFDMSSMTKEKADGTKNAVDVCQEVELDTGRVAAIEGYNIDGRVYFSIRHIAKFLDFSCEWNAKTNTVTIDTTKINAERREDAKKIKDGTYFINEEVYYLFGSDDYSEIETHIQKTYDSNFKIADYIVEDIISAQVVMIPIEIENGYADNALVAYETLHIRYDVNGVPANYGYDIEMSYGRVSKIEKHGVWNSAFSMDKTRKSEYTKTDVIQMAKEKQGDLTGITIAEETVDAYFDMQSLTYKYIVELSLEKDGVQLGTSSDLFEEAGLKETVEKE